MELVTKVSQLQEHYIKFKDWWSKWQIWFEYAKWTLHKVFDIGHVDHALDEELSELANCLFPIVALDDFSTLDHHNWRIFSANTNWIFNANIKMKPWEQVRI
jgi:hypothetical protein